MGGKRVRIDLDSGLLVRNRHGDGDDDGKLETRNGKWDREIDGQVARACTIESKINTI